MSHLMFHYLDCGLSISPEHTAIEEPGKGEISYRGLNSLAGCLRNRLRRLGVSRGDRVGIYMRKSIDAVASIFGILKTGAAYVPVDPTAPVTRGAYILSDCSVKVIITEGSYAEALSREIDKHGANPEFIVLDQVGGGKGLKMALSEETETQTTDPDEMVSPDDLAYILYTSGSTGKPKGVMLSHRNGASFVDWCVDTFRPLHSDRFASHAPFHFDLSILDIYVSIKHGATLVLIGEEEGKDPARLAPLIAERRISIWYSAPSILGLLAQYGHLERYVYSSLRMILFAGEVFPVKHLRKLKSLLPGPRHFNLYGPTETNVCTFYEIPAQIPDGQTKPFPIGKTCSHLEIKVIDEQGKTVANGEEGELCVCGPAVAQGYWNLPEQTARAYILDPSGQPWYRTGDIVSKDADGNYIFLGRRDRMVKKRGYRVELGEIEACLYCHSAIKEVGIIALPDDNAGVRIKAFLSTRDENRPSQIDLKQFCAERLPIYMVPDLFAFAPSLPKTSTGKIDYQKLKEIN